MRSVFISACAVFCAACAFCAEQVVDGVSVVEGPKGYNCWPMIQALSDRLVCVYTCGARHDPSERGRGTFARVSQDGGRTWGERVCVAQYPDCAMTSVAKGLDSDGAALFWVRSLGSERPRHTLYRTTDGARFEPISTLNEEPLPMQITDIFQVKGVGLMALWFGGSYGDDDKPRWWGTVTSSDNGKTWHQRICGKDLPLSDWPTEPSVAVLDDGRLLAIARTEKMGAPQFQLTSLDGGKTWKVARTNIEDVFLSTPSLIYEAKTNLLTLYYYERGKGVLRRRTVQAKAVFDSPTAWPDSEELVCDQGALYDAGNANATSAAGRHYVAWYAGKASDCSVKVLKR